MLLNKLEHKETKLKHDKYDPEFTELINNLKKEIVRI
jgi:hypothetical protein